MGACFQYLSVKPSDTKLTLNGFSLQSIAGVEALRNLVHLDVSGNRLRKMEVFRLSFLSYSPLSYVISFFFSIFSSFLFVLLTFLLIFFPFLYGFLLFSLSLVFIFHLCHLLRILSGFKMAVFAELTNLRYLDLRYNEIGGTKQIVRALYQCKNLQTLFIHKATRRDSEKPRKYIKNVCKVLSWVDTVDSLQNPFGAQKLVN